jgi:hypothetical protein
MPHLFLKYSLSNFCPDWLKLQFGASQAYDLLSLCVQYFLMSLWWLVDGILVKEQSEQKPEMKHGI